MASIDGKAMIVAMSREICVHLYNAIVELHPDWHDNDPNKGAIKIVMTGRHLIASCYSHTSITSKPKKDWKSVLKILSILSS
jgi:type I site-specific restriction-modification system R (restriction) subunit